MALNDINFAAGLSGVLSAVTYGDEQNFIIELSAGTKNSVTDIVYPTPTRINGILLERPIGTLNAPLDILTTSAKNTELLIFELTLTGGTGEVSYAFVS